MITHYWLEKGISTLLLLVFAFLAFLSFGYPEYFDRLFLIFLLCLSALYKRNPDIASIAIIVILIRLVNEVLFLYQGSYEQPLYYFASCLIIYKFKFDKHISFLLLPVLVTCLLSEIYWLFIGYESPGLGIYVLSIAVNCWMRYLLIFRPHITKSCSKLNLSGISLDYDLYRLAGASNIVVTLLIYEYLIRHLTPLNPLFIYEVYSYILQLITALFPYFVISYLIKARFTIDA